MSQIAKNFFSQSPVLDLAIAALVIFIGIFLAVVVRTFMTSKQELNDAALIPLRGESPNTAKHMHGDTQ